MVSTLAYWIGLLCSAGATLFVVTAYGGRYLEEWWRGDPLHAWAWSEVRVLAALVLPPLVTLLAILWGWRRDRRHVQTLTQQLRECERTNNDLGLQLLSAQAPTRPPLTRQGPHEREGGATPRA